MTAPSSLLPAARPPGPAFAGQAEASEAAHAEHLKTPHFQAVWAAFQRHGAEGGDHDRDNRVVVARVNVR